MSLWKRSAPIEGADESADVRQRPKGLASRLRKLGLWCAVFFVSCALMLGGAWSSSALAIGSSGSASGSWNDNTGNSTTVNPGGASASGSGNTGGTQSGGGESSGSGDLPTAQYWNEVTPKDLGSGEINDDTTMYNVNPTVNLTDLGNIVNSVNKLGYSIFGNGAWNFAKLSNDFMGQIGGSSLFNEGYADGAYNVVYDVCVKVADNVAVPVATGFLGLALVLALINFTKEVAQTNHGTTDLLANYMFIIVKFGVIQLCISNTTLIMQGIYELVREVGMFMAKIAMPSQVGALAYTDGFAGAVNNILKSITFSEGTGAAIIVFLVAMVAFVCSVMTVVYVNVVAIMRMFEVYVRSAFAALPMVMLGNRTTKDGGIRYFKKYAGCCLQALVIILIVALGGPMLSAGGSLLQTALGNNSGGFAGLIVSVLPPLCSCVALMFMVKQSRAIADEIVGA